MENTEDRTKSEEVKAVESERLELLRAVAECAPKEWGASIGIDCIAFEKLSFRHTDQHDLYLDFGEDDTYNAEFIILMRQEIERRGFYFRESTRRLIVFQYRGGPALGEYHCGAIAERWARAFVTCMEAHRARA